jgi:hypothetical protein
MTTLLFVIIPCKSSLFAIDNILPSVAIIVSLIAIVSSAWYNRKTLKMTKNHYATSVETLLHIWFESLPDYHKLVLKTEVQDLQ